MDRLIPGTTYKAGSGYTLRIEAAGELTAAAVAEYPDGHRETVLIAMEEWPMIVEREALIPAGLAA